MRVCSSNYCGDRRINAVVQMTEEGTQEGIGTIADNYRKGTGPLDNRYFVFRMKISREAIERFDWLTRSRTWHVASRHPLSHQLCFLAASVVPQV